MCVPGGCTAAVGDTSMQDQASLTAGKLVLCMAPYSSHCELQWSSNYATLHTANQQADLAFKMAP